jgi:hypothetical protein
LAWARRRVLVEGDEVLAAIRDGVPVDSIVVAQSVVLLNPDGASQYGRQPPQTNLLQVKHLVNHQSVILEQAVAANHRQVGKQKSNIPQSSDAIKHKVTRYFTQFWKTDILEIRLVGTID